MQAQINLIGKYKYWPKIQKMTSTQQAFQNNEESPGFRSLGVLKIYITGCP